VKITARSRGKFYGTIPEFALRFAEQNQKKFMGSVLAKLEQVISKLPVSKRH
jgi:hypothetical protein